MRIALPGYRESGGAFPARFDDQSDAVTELRLGFHWSRPLSNFATFTGGLQAARRFEARGADASGAVIGLSEFTVPGMTYHRDWLQAHIGVDFDLSGSLVSVLIDATTAGESPAATLTVVWRGLF